MELISALPDLVMTPPGYRELADEAQVLGILRCTPLQLRELVCAGFVCEDERYDFSDAWNLGLYSGSGRTRPEWEMVAFARSLRSFGADWVSRRRYSVTGSAECRYGADCPSADWSEPSFPGVRWTGRDIRAGTVKWHGEIEVRGWSGTVQDPRVRDAWKTLIERYRFQFTPERIALDVTMSRERKVGDCSALCRVLMRDLLDADVQVELQSGYLFGGFQLRQHCWLEVIDVDGKSKVLDPSMALLARRFFTSEYEAFCFGSRFNRMLRRASHEDGLLSHPCFGGSGIEYDFTLRSIR